MAERKIYITEFDKARLEDLIAAASSAEARHDLQALAGELDRAEIVPVHAIPADVVTMNSKVVLRDLATAETMTYILVFPGEANLAVGALSILAPVGTAILGYAQGEVIDWPVPAGVRRIRIESILYQPEAAGDYHR